jgi:hypothetical protein
MLRVSKCDIWYPVWRVRGVRKFVLVWCFDRNESRQGDSPICNPGTHKFGGVYSEHTLSDSVLASRRRSERVNELGISVLATHFRTHNSTKATKCSLSIRMEHTHNEKALPNQPLLKAGGLDETPPYSGRQNLPLYLHLQVHENRPSTRTCLQMKSEFVGPCCRQRWHKATRCER